MWTKTGNAKGKKWDICKAGVERDSKFFRMMLPRGILPSHITQLTKDGQNYNATLRALVSVHGRTLGVAAELAICGGADGSATTAVAAAASSTALLESQQLLSAESLVVDLAGGLDQVLEVGTGQEVAQVDELAVVLILDVDDTPAVLTATNLLAVDHNGLLTTNN